MQKRSNRSGQAALEFMMTYGWAILVVIIAISALSYYGVLRADRFLPDTCTISPGLTCLSFKATTDTLDLVVQNDLGQDITVTDITVSGCSYNTATSLVSGAKTTFTFSACTFGASGKKLKSDVSFTYRDEELLYHTRTGQLITKVE